jgi:AcrR family transcriptional regulator
MVPMAVKDGVYGGRTHAERRLERRERLLAAVLAVWGGDDPRPVTMTRVCAEAGLSERYFYEQFTNLEAAQVAVMERLADEIAQAAVAALDAAEGGPEAKMRAGLSAFVRILTDDPRKGRVAMLETVAVPALRPRRTALLHDFVALVAREARTLHGPAAWGEREGRLAATMFVGGVAQLVTDWLEGGLDATPEEIVDAATHLSEATGHR